MADFNSKKCNLEKCENNIFRHGYCEKHYTQIRRHGRILNRTRHDSNEIISLCEYSLLCLYNMKQEKVADTKIDNEDVKAVKKYKWCLLNNEAVVTDSTGERFLLHRFLMQAESSDMIDHIDRDRLNNRKKNLRICCHKENSRNLSKRKNNTSGHPGVIWCKRNKRWKAQIHFNGRCVYLGNFLDMGDAVNCRLKAEQKYFKEFAPRRDNWLLSPKQ